MMHNRDDILAHIQNLIDEGKRLKQARIFVPKRVEYDNEDMQDRFIKVRRPPRISHEHYECDPVPMRKWLSQCTTILESIFPKHHVQYEALVLKTAKMYANSDTPDEVIPILEGVRDDLTTGILRLGRTEAISTDTHPEATDNAVPLKPVVFVSHITEEKELAIAIKVLLEAAFKSTVDVFVSSSDTGVMVGDKWLSLISDRLKQCVVEIVLVSPVSVGRPWINFEAGAGWIRDIPVIPVLHSGMTVTTLPRPYNDLQSALATDEFKMSQVVSRIANTLGLTIGPVDLSNFIQTVEAFQDSYQPKKEQILGEPSEDEMSALRCIAEIADPVTLEASFTQFKSNLRARGHDDSRLNIITMLLRAHDLIALREEQREGKPSFIWVQLTGPAMRLISSEAKGTFQELSAPEKRVMSMFVKVESKSYPDFYEANLVEYAKSQQFPEVLVKSSITQLDQRGFVKAEVYVTAVIYRKVTLLPRGEQWLLANSE